MRLKIIEIGETDPPPQFSIGDVYELKEPCIKGCSHIVMPSGHVYWLEDMQLCGDVWELLP